MKKIVAVSLEAVHTICLVSNNNELKISKYIEYKDSNSLIF